MSIKIILLPILHFWSVSQWIKFSDRVLIKWIQCRSINWRSLSFLSLLLGQPSFISRGIHSSILGGLLSILLARSWNLMHRLSFSLSLSSLHRCRLLWLTNNFLSLLLGQPSFISRRIHSSVRGRWLSVLLGWSWFLMHWLSLNLSLSTLHRCRWLWLTNNFLSLCLSILLCRHPFLKCLWINTRCSWTSITLRSSLTIL